MIFNFFILQRNKIFINFHPRKRKQKKNCGIKKEKKIKIKKQRKIKIRYFTELKHITRNLYYTLFFSILIHIHFYEYYLVTLIGMKK